MAKIKNILLMGLSLFTVAVIAVGGTLAYLTSTDSDVNVMTVGNVQVELQEKQRNKDGSALVDFVQGKELTPLVGSAQGAKDKWGQPSKDQASNYVDKIVYATNTGKNDAYIRFLVAIPTTLIPDTADSSNNPLHWSWGNRVDITGKSTDNGDAINTQWKKQFKYADIEENNAIASVTIDGEEYWVTYFTMQETLAPGADSLAVMAGLYLDNRVDYDADRGVYTFKGEAINYDFSEGVKIPVMVQAVQADGFKIVDDAFTSAYGAVTVANAESWFNGVKAPTVVDEVADLSTALANGKDAVLADNVSATSPVVLNGSTLNGGGNTLDSDYEGTSAWGQYAITIPNGGTVENINVVDAFRGIGSTNTSEDIYIDNVTIDNVTYAINGNGNGTASVYVTNSTIYGWLSYADIALFSFENCTVGKGNSYDGYMVVYGDTSFTNVTFKEFDMCADSSVKAGSTVTFTNCTNDGVKVTADNFKDLFMYPGDDVDFNKLQNCTIVVDGVTVTW